MSTQAKFSTDPDVHAHRVSAMFQGIVPWYDFLNHLLSGSMDRLWRDCLAQIVLLSSAAVKNAHPMIPDLAAGTLDVARAVRRHSRKVQIPALDFCLPMLRYGKDKIGRQSAICPIVADARNLPLPDASADGLTMAFGIRNILPREAAFAEMLRVLKPGGRACILEFGSGKKTLWLGLYNFYLKHVLTLIGKISGRGDAYRYLSDTILAFPDADTLADELHNAGFSRVYWLPLCSGIVCLHVAEKS